LQRQNRTLFYPIDVSPSALDEAVRQLGQQFPALRVNPIVATTPAASRAGPDRWPQAGALHRSSIGNFEPDEAVRILRRIRRTLRSAMLCCWARFRQEFQDPVPAYDDAQGVTASFNKNILARLNRELDADFNLDAFRHIALWNRRVSRMEIYLESLTDQTAFLPPLDLDLPSRQANAFTPKTATSTPTP